MQWLTEDNNSAAVVAFAVTGIVIIVCVSVAMALFPQLFVRVNHVQPDATYLGSPPLPVSHSFSFRNETITINASLNRSVYEGARKTDRKIFTFVIVPFRIWVGESLKTMAQDPAMDGLFDELLGQFRQIRAERNLSDDEYAELMTAYAQSFRYHTVHGAGKYPVETLYDGEGDCDDMSLVLAGLLSREGYRTSILLFEKDDHVVVGIGSDDNRYLGTDYAYVDIMDYSFIGVPVNSLRGSGELYQDPVVIPIGSGTKIYGSGNETRYIASRAMQSYLRSGNLSLRMKEMPQDTEENISAYNRAREEFSRSSEVYTYIIRHRFDRPGVYAYLQREMPA